MEQLQTILAVVKKHHFWILAGVVLVVSLAVYKMATGALNTEFQSRKGKINSSMQQANSVASVPNHPNEQKIKNWTSLHKQQSQKVLNGWNYLYKWQDKENPWPRILSEEFRQWIDKNKEFPDKRIPTNFREQYRNFIKEELPKLFELVNYRHYPDDPAATLPRGGMTVAGRRATQDQPDSKLIGVVDWSETNRQALIDQYDFGRTTPSSLTVRLAQEDYWVYQALLNIIKSTNGDATTHSSAAVKEIVLLQIGQDAAASIQSNQGADLLGAATAASPTTGRSVARQGTMPQTRSAPSTNGGPALSEADMALLKDRYVDESLKPLPAGVHSYAEFKMMPILMQLRIHQRNIPDLFVKCANSTMPVEVKQFRFNPGSSGSGGGGGGRATRGGPARGGGAAAGTQVVDEDNPYEVTIEIRGIIYLYNPPDKAKLATGTVAEQTTSGAAPPETPEGTTPVEGTTPDDQTPPTETRPPTPDPATVNP